MKLGFLLGYSGKNIHIPVELIKQAESIGYDSIIGPQRHMEMIRLHSQLGFLPIQKNSVGTAIMQIQANSCDVCNDCNVPRSALRWAVYCGS